MTLTETLRVIDAQALADVLGALFLEEGGDARHIAIDGKTMRASKDSEGKAEHVLSAFCSSLQTVLGHEASRSKGLEIPDALKLLERLDLRGKIVTGDAIFCQKSIAAKIVERGGDYVFPVKDNQKTLRQDIETAFNEPVFPLCSWNSDVKRRMGASNGARSTCCLPKPSGFKASGRRFGKSVASYVRAKSRRTASGRSHSTRSSIRLQLARRHLATGVAGRQSQSLADRDHASKTRTSSSARTATRIVRQRSSKHFLPHRLRSQNPEIRGTLTNPRHRAPQDDRNRAIRLFSGFY